MNLVITSYDPDNVPKEEEISLPDPRFYEAVGGEEGFKKMIGEFYDRIVESDIAFFFPQDDEEIEKIKRHNGKYFAEIAGGPKRYSEELGHVDQVKMHKPFSINEKHRTEWLGTWREVLEIHAKNVEPKIVESYFRFLDTYSKLLINRPRNARAFDDLAKV
ncbi:globin [Hydrogenimonas urashimensis]|uniref:globin domain-containing protein n=1 Tax=Hydrogenimonas urashimensis TaxID=2740515 RepID=UPI001915F967|nr:globin [Hydrogenimonas urashimensis]